MQNHTPCEHDFEGNFKNCFFLTLKLHLLEYENEKCARKIFTQFLAERAL